MKNDSDEGYERTDENAPEDEDDEDEVRVGRGFGFIHRISSLRSAAVNAVLPDLR